MRRRETWISSERGNERMIVQMDLATGIYDLEFRSGLGNRDL
jgi:hypothetical protein